MELRFQFNEHSSILIPPIKLTSDTEVNYLFDMTKMHMTSLCVTLVKRMSLMMNPGTAEPGINICSYVQ